MEKTSSRRMSDRMQMLLVALILIAMAGSLAAPVIMTQYVPRYMAATVKVGWTRERVVARLGPPEHVAHSVGEFKDRFMCRPVPTPAVDGEVLEYGHLLWHAYIYIDQSGRVSRVFVVRSE